MWGVDESAASESVCAVNVVRRGIRRIKSWVGAQSGSVQSVTACNQRALGICQGSSVGSNCTSHGVTVGIRDGPPAGSPSVGCPASGLVIRRMPGNCGQGARTGNKVRPGGPIRIRVPASVVTGLTGCPGSAIAHWSKSTTGDWGPPARRTGSPSVQKWVKAASARGTL